MRAILSRVTVFEKRSCHRGHRVYGGEPLYKQCSLGGLCDFRGRFSFLGRALALLSSARVVNRGDVAVSLWYGATPHPTRRTAMPFYEKGNVRIRYEETG